MSLKLLIFSIIITTPICNVLFEAFKTDIISILSLLFGTNHSAFLHCTVIGSWAEDVTCLELESWIKRPTCQIRIFGKLFRKMLFKSIASAPMGAWKCKFPHFNEIIQTDQATDLQTDIRGHGEVTLVLTIFFSHDIHKHSKTLYLLILSSNDFLRMFRSIVFI